MINSQTPAPYVTTPAEDATIAAALAILDRRAAVQADREQFTSSDAVKTHLRLAHSGLRQEVLTCLFLSNAHALIAREVMFHGTIDGAAVYPREIVRRALELGAAAVIMSHNHPSGTPEPSHADQSITLRVKSALATVDIRLLDHVITSEGGAVSLA